MCSPNGTLTQTPSQKSKNGMLPQEELSALGFAKHLSNKPTFEGLNDTANYFRDLHVNRNRNN